MKTPPAELVSNLQAIGDRLLAAGAPPRLEDVAREVGVSRASLYYWFSGQDDLVAFLLTSHARAGAAAVDEAVDASAPPPTRLRQMVAAMVRYLGAHPGTCAGLLRAAGDTNLSAVLAINDDLVAAPLRAELDACRDEGSLRVPDSQVAANAVMGGVLMAVLGHAAADGDTTDDDFVAAVTDQALHGLLADG